MADLFFFGDARGWDRMVLYSVVAGFWCRGDRRDGGRGGDWELCNPLWWKGAAAEMNMEGFWFACLFAMFLPCTIFQGLFG